MKYNVAQIYENYWNRDVTDAEKVGWINTEQQFQNFQVLVDMLRESKVVLPGLTLHDAGCGTGELLHFLKQEELEPRHYLGTDIMPHAIKMAQVRFPSHDFKQYDLVKPGMLDIRSDVTMAVGALGFHKPRVVEKILNHLWENTTCALAFNTWWELSDFYLYSEHMVQLQKCVNRFLRGKLYHQRLGTEYGQPLEAAFVVFR